MQNNGEHFQYPLQHNSFIFNVLGCMLNIMCVYKPLYIQTDNAMKTFQNQNELRCFTKVT
jgi:hypothetical protein